MLHSHQVPRIVTVRASFLEALRTPGITYAHLSSAFLHVRLLLKLIYIWFRLCLSRKLIWALQIAPLRKITFNTSVRMHLQSQTLVIIMTRLIISSQTHRMNGTNNFPKALLPLLRVTAMGWDGMQRLDFSQSSEMTTIHFHVNWYLQFFPHLIYF